MAQIEPMDIDSEFDNKENSLHHSNVLPRTPSTEKGYEELDVSELNMKLRYSITPASSPMSKSFTANSLDNRTFDSEDYLNNIVINENCNLTRSLNSTITRNDMTKLPKSLPLQVLSTESVTENRNTSVLCTLDKAPGVHDNNVTITMNAQNYLDDNMSLPSTSSSVAQTPEATTPTKDIPKHDGGSPIMRGLKSVLNMFRSSQSPIPPADVNVTLKEEIVSPKGPVLIEDMSKSHIGMASTPITNKQREISSSQRNSPLKESIVFNDDLERELQWKDETTILFKEEKIPIHKLLLPQSLSAISKIGEAPSVSYNAEKETLNNTVEHMDISYSDSFSDIKVGRHIHSANITSTNDPLMIESDGEFVDCETTINNDDITDNKIMGNLTSSINRQNITLQHSQNVLQMHTEQSIANIESETLKNYCLQTKCDKNEISTTNKEDCNNGEMMNGKEMASKINKEKSSDHNLRQLNDTEQILTGTILCENLSKEQMIKIEESFAVSKHPSDIPLPDEDDLENVLNFDQVLMSTTKLQELKSRADHQMDMSIDCNETFMIEKDCSCENKETKVLDLDSIGKNETTVKEINLENNQEIVVDNANNDELFNVQCINIKGNIQNIELNDNLTPQIENAPQVEKYSIIPINEELNSKTNDKIIMDSLEANNGIKLETVSQSLVEKTKCDLNINQKENNIIFIQDNQSAITDHLNEIAINNEANLHSMESLKQEHESTYILEKIDNINSTNSLGSNNTFCTVNNDGKECCSNQIELNFESNQVCNLATEDYEDSITVPENIKIESSSSFTQPDNQNFEINMEISQKVQESQNDETILQSKCSLELDNVDVLKDNTTLADDEKTCNIIENVEIITLGKEMLNIDIADKIENLSKEEGKDTLLKEVINSKEENFTHEESKETLFKEVINTKEENFTQEESKATLLKEVINTKEENCTQEESKETLLKEVINTKEENFTQEESKATLLKEVINTKEENFTQEESKETLLKEVINTKEENFTQNESKETLLKEVIVTKEENFTQEESIATLLKEVINTKEENSTGRTIESEIVFKQNVNELRMQISPTNKTFNMSIGQEDLFKNNEIKEKTYKFDHDAKTLHNNVSDKKNETVENNNLNNVVPNETDCTTELIDHITTNVIFNMSIVQEDEIENKNIKEKANECEDKSDAVNIQISGSESLYNNTRNTIISNVTGECGLNQQSVSVCNSVLNEQVSPNVTFTTSHKSTCQKIENEKNEGTVFECGQEIDAINMSHDDKILDSNNPNSLVVNETKECNLNAQNLIVSNLKIDDHVISNIASNATFTMRIDQEEISESKDTYGRTGECVVKANLLNICPQKNKILNSNNCNSAVVNENGEGPLNPQYLTASNSNIDDQIISNVTSNATFNMSIDKEDINENKEKTDECIHEADKSGECAINKQNITVCNSNLNDYAIFNAMYIADDKQEENTFLGQLSNQTHIKSEENTEPVFLPERRSSRSENIAIKADVIDQRNFLDNMDCEIKNVVKKVENLMDTSSKTSNVSSQNGSDKVEPERLNEESKKNIELSDCLTEEIKCKESPPLSPVISSKGYNFNFDEIDDPFATKTRIRSSPTLEDNPRSNEKGINKPKSANIIKKDFQRRKSMPFKRQQQTVKEKKKINSTFSEAVDYKEIKQYALQTTMEMETETAIANATCDNLQVSGYLPPTILEKSSVKTTELPPCQTEETQSYIDGLINNENVHKSEVHCTQTETSSHEAETTSNLSNPAILSVDKREAKSVFNLPEMSTDMNFSPFVTKSKVCRTPSPALEACASSFKVSADFNEPGSQSVNPDGEMVSAKLNVGNKADYDSSIASSLSKATEDATVREVNTEDEDTVEGPFFEADELNDDDKMSDMIADTDDMMTFNHMLPQVTDDNVDNGEMFIDAEAFEFLLNQNKSNMVVDSGKESLFLKFDPLFAKRMSSDGVLAALNKVQKRQSTPKKISKTSTMDFTYCDKTPTGTLNLNATTEVNSTLENNFEDPNTTISKPMMVVNPAVNSVISPRNKPIATPPRANRRSLTFTSPAIAVIDRLLSLSGNNSILNSETPTRQVRREQNETDLALTQLRELLAEKEIHVHNLRMESKDLKERLSSLEMQIKSLESESEQRLRKVNELNERLVEKTNINRSMAAVVEEYERTIASLIAETEQDKKRHAEERMRLVKERDEQTAHLASMEISFNDLHSKYEKSKRLILACKANEDKYRRSIKEFDESLLKMQNNYELLKQHATSKLNQANQEWEQLNRAHEAEVVKLNAMIKRKELHITSLEETVAQKTKANEELTAICDELINRVG